MQSTENRVGYIDIARILSAIAVVVIHTLSIIAQDGDIVIGSGVWLTMDVIHRWLNWCIPVFYMMTGILWLGNERECTDKEVAKHIWKFALALVIFGFTYPMVGYLGEGLSPAKALFASLKDWIMGDAWYHLWYVYDVIGAYLFLPVAKLVFKADKKILKTVTVVTFIMMILRKLPFTQAIDFPITGYAFYLFMGGIFARYEIKKKNVIRASVAFVIASLIMILAAIKFDAEKWGVGLNSFVFYGYRTIPCFILALSILTLLRSWLKNYQPGKFVLTLSSCTWGIYLLHPMFLVFMTRLGIYPLNYPVWWSVPLACVVIFVLSFASTWLLRLIKPLRKYLM